MVEVETSSVRLETSEVVGLGSSARWTMMEQMGEGTMVVYRTGVVKMVVVWVRVRAMGKA